MATTNASSPVSEFELICFPGVPSWQHFVSIPLTLLFLVSLSANITLLATIYTAQNLHQPMYYSLCLLALVDLLLSFSVSPKTLAILWLDQKTISSAACFSQTFLLNFCQGMESSIFIFLAYDRYIAICNPLRYSSIITDKLTAQVVALSLTSNAILFLPFPFLVAKLRYCETHTMVHCFCTSLALAQIACENTAVESLYSLAVLSIFLSINTLSMTFSYTMIIRAVLRLRSTESALKAFHTCSSHLIVIAYFYSILIAIAISSRVKESIPRDIHILLAVLRYVTPPALYPLTYGIRSQDIRQAFKNQLRKARLMYEHR